MFGIGVAYQPSLQTQCRLSRFTEGFSLPPTFLPKKSSTSLCRRISLASPRTGSGLIPISDRSRRTWLRTPNSISRCYWLIVRNSHSRSRGAPQNLGSMYAFYCKLSSLTWYTKQRSHSSLICRVFHKQTHVESMRTLRVAVPVYKRERLREKKSFNSTLLVGCRSSHVHSSWTLPYL